jgi:hypothetical protein
MRHDPFDEMSRRNPIPSDQEPSAPMSEATRIVGARFVMPGWAVAVAAAAVVVAIGGATLLFVDRTDPTIAAAGTTTSSAAESLVESTVATSSPADTAPLVATSNPPVFDAGEVVVYFIIDDPTATGSAQSLVPVTRSLATISAEITDLPSMTLAFLLAGPTNDEIESIPAITSAVPDGTRLLGLTVEDRVATVDLSAEFATGSGSFSEIARLEQLVYTLTRFDDIDGIRLQLDGVPVEVFGGHGIELDDPVIRTEFDLTLPAIMIETPPYPESNTPNPNGTGFGSNPLVASGTANVFEASVSMALADSQGLILWEGFTTATCGTGCLGDWSVSIPYTVDVAQRGSLIVWEESAQDGSQINIREHPVWLIPAESVEATPTTLSPDAYVCSGSFVDPVLVDQPGLPAPNASIRSAIFEAAVQCDWEALRTLQAEGFMYSFGGGGDAIAEWQMLEILGEEPMRFLAELLNRPYGTQPGPDGSEYYAWPSAFVDEWSLVAEADREALRPLYDDADFAVFSDFGGYFGYRVGIIDGTWVYFIAGD